MEIGINELAEQLTHAREEQVSTIVDALLGEGFVGITGDPLVGKSLLVNRALALIGHHHRARTVRIDLQGAYSLAKLVARWHHALLRAAAGTVATSHAAALPREFWPASTEAALLDARDLLGSAYDGALIETPAKGAKPADVAAPLEATARLARRCPVVLVIDHLEAPLLTTRHPIDPAALLWEIRAAAQSIDGFRVAVVCAPAAQPLAAGPDAAFFGDGRWLTIPSVDLTHWHAASYGSLDAAERELVRLSRGTIPSALRLLRDHRPDEDPGATFRRCAQDDQLHAARCVQHAFSLHRLGGHVLTSIAAGAGAYAATPDARSDDVAGAVEKLRLAGLLRRDPDDARGWLLVDPLVEHALRPVVPEDPPGSDPTRPRQPEWE